jgi:transposase
MYGVELYGLVRRAVMLEGLSQRAAARRFGIDRGTVGKMMASPAPPGYRRQMPVRRPKLADHEGFFEQVLTDDERAPAKQRHTARRIFERLRDERGFDGCYSTVRDFVRSQRQLRKEVSVPLTILETLIERALVLTNRELESHAIRLIHILHGGCRLRILPG